MHILSQRGPRQPLCDAVRSISRPMLRLFALMVVVTATATAAVTTVETRITPLSGERATVEHRLTGISGGAYVPLPAGVEPTVLEWNGTLQRLDYSKGWDAPPPTPLLNYLSGPILHFQGDGPLAVVRYTVAIDGGRIIEPLGTARLERSRATVAISVDVAPGAIAYSPSHELTHGRALGTPQRPLPDTPLVVLPMQPQPGTLTLASVAVAPTDGEDGFVLIAISGRAAATRPPLKIAFALDISGSMQGEKLVQAKRALQDAASRLNPQDTFEFISFSHGVQHHQFSKGDFDLTSAIAGLSAGGATNLSGAMVLPGQSGLSVDTVVVLTDGQPTAGITTEIGIREAVAAAYRGNSVSLHAIGIGHDVNAPLLDAVTSAQHGGVVYITPGEDVRSGVSNLLARLGRPAGRNLALSALGVTLTDSQPAMDAIGDCFDGEVRVVVARYRQPGKLTVRLSERQGGAINERAELSIDLPAETPAAHAVIRRLWAARMVAAVEGAVRIDNRPMTAQEIATCNDLGFRYGVPTNTNLEQIQALGDGQSAALSLGSYQKSTGSFGSRAGNQAVSQSRDWYFNRDAVNPRQTVLGNEGQEVQMEGLLYNFSNASAFRNGEQWVDGALVAADAAAAANGEAPTERQQVTIQRNTPAWEELAKKLVELRKEGLLTLEGKVQVLVDETVYDIE